MIPRMVPVRTARALNSRMTVCGKMNGSNLGEGEAMAVGLGKRRQIERRPVPLQARPDGVLTTDGIVSQQAARNGRMSSNPFFPAIARKDETPRPG